MRSVPIYYIALRALPTRKRPDTYAYTGIDDTGAISYADRRWNSDPTHPSQLWYDVSGNLMGADFSVPRPHQEARPVVWGIDPGRWYEFNGHVHYTIVDPSSKKTIYDQWVWNDDFTAAGGSLGDPSAETLVKLGRIPSATDVGTIFEFPDNLGSRRVGASSQCRLTALVRG